MTALRHSLRILERDRVIVARMWHGFVFSGLVQPLLYLLAMGVGVGGYVDDERNLGGLDYLEFVAPALMVASAFQLVVGESLWPVMGGYRWEKRYHAMVAAPPSPTSVFVHHLLWESLRAIVSAALFLVVAAPLGALASPWALLALPAVVLTVLGVAAPTAAFSAWTDDDANFQLVMRFGVLPLFLFSGTFFPVSELPDLLQHLVPLSPLYHGVELARAACAGQARSVAAVLAHVGALAATAGAGTAWGRRTFAKRLAA